MVISVVFDFDGVLVDSNRIKRNAYFEMFAGHGDRKTCIAEIVDRDRYSGRYVIIGKILRCLSEEGVLEIGDRFEALVQDYATRYNDICENYAATCREIKGASALLSKLSAGLHLYVNSSTPQEPLRRIIARRGWSNYFHAVLGAPKTKKQNLEWIIGKEQVPASQVVVVSDGKADLEAARDLGSPFIAVVNDFNDFERDGLKLISDLEELEEAMQERFGRARE
jgi:phosphoglycolate phosphatase-like HAD superfamily hydrolase